MARADLLALTADDLTTLANRGLVKRAQQEIDAGQPACELTEGSEGSVIARWSDDIECRLPAGATVAEGQCTCPATTLCRHLIRTVLAYQQQEAAAKSDVPGPEPAVWDPGGLNDDSLERQIGKSTLARSRRLYEEGQVVELTRSRKPSAVMHTLSCTVRFLVPDDLRYTHCDCSESNPCSHVALAVWAFRCLPPDADGGLVSTKTASLPIPTELLDAIELALAELAAIGVAGAAQAFTDRLRRLEEQTRSAGLVWPAEILADLVLQVEGYRSHDSRFSPVRVAELVGEMCIRVDAIRADTGAVPPLFVRGSASDRTTDVGSARLVGLGCGVQAGRGSTEISAYLQDVDSGAVVAIRRDFADPEAPKPPRPFASVAKAQVIRGTSLAALGAGQVLVKGGKRTPSGQFLPGRAPASFQPQGFAWESLRSPVLTEDFAELRVRLASLPPASLRPRRVGQNLFVCPVSGALSSAFLSQEQSVTARLTDRSGGTATLLHPYLARSAAGTEVLLSHLRTQPENLRFVAGNVHLAASGLVIMPTALVFEKDGRRFAIQPWVDAEPAQTTSVKGLPAAQGPGQTPPAAHPWALFLNHLQETAGELLLLGLSQSGDRIDSEWEGLQERGAALGFVLLLTPLKTIADQLRHRRETLRWDPARTAEALLRLLVVVEMAKEQMSERAA